MVDQEVLGTRTAQGEGEAVDTIRRETWSIGYHESFAGCFEGIRVALYAGGEGSRSSCRGVAHEHNTHLRTADGSVESFESAIEGMAHMVPKPSRCYRCPDGMRWNCE